VASSFVPGHGKAKEKVSNFLGNDRRLRWYEWTGLGIMFLICANNFIIGPLKADYLVVATVESKSYQTTDGQIVKIEKMPFGSDLRLTPIKRHFRFLPWGDIRRRFFCPDIFERLAGQKPACSKRPADKEFVFLTDILGQNIKEDPLDYRSRIILGDLYTFWGLIDNSKFVLAESTLQDAIKLAPDDQEGYWNLAQTKLFEMRINDALSLAQKALAMEPDHPKSRELIYKIQDIIKKIGDNRRPQRPDPDLAAVPAGFDKRLATLIKLNRAGLPKYLFIEAPALKVHRVYMDNDPGKKINST